MPCVQNDETSFDEEARHVVLVLVLEYKFEVPILVLEVSLLVLVLVLEAWVLVLVLEACVLVAICHVYILQVLLLLLLQPFYGPLSGTTRVSRYQKKHSPTHHPDRHPIFISFFHLLRSVESSLFNLRVWQSFSTIYLQVLFGLPLGLEPGILAAQSNSGLAEQTVPACTESTKRPFVECSS